MSASAMQNLGRAPDTTPDAQQSAAQESTARVSSALISGATAGSISSPASTSLNGAHANGSDSIRTGLQLIPSPNEAQAALQSSASQIARLQSSPGQPTARAAAEAYQTQAGAQTQVTQPAAASPSQGFNMLA